MAIDVEDVVQKSPISGETGITTTYFEGRFNQQTRVLEFKFSQKKIAKLDDGRTFEDPIPQEIRVVLSDPSRQIPLLNRRTGSPTGNDISAGRLTQAIASLFVEEQRAAAEAAEAAAAPAAAADQLQEGHDLL